MAFYVCYIVIVIMLLQSFRLCIDVVKNTVDSIVNLLNVFLPVLTTLLISSGNYMSLSMVHPVVILISEVMTMVIKEIIIPFIFLSAVFEIINYISEKNVLGNLSELMKKCIGWGIKGISLVFTTTLTIQKLTLPAVEGIVNKTAKLAIGAIPVVGEVMTGTVDTVLSFSGLVKNSTAIAVILFMFIVCSLPILKLIALIFVYRFTSAIIQPISDSRIIKCIDGIAGSCQLLLGSLVCTMIMFVLVAIIGISNVIT
jgi:stage III sporulation protein AE